MSLSPGKNESRPDSLAISSQEADPTKDPSPSPVQFEDRGGYATLDALLKINLGIEDEPHPTFINENMSPGENEVYTNFLKKT